MYVNIDIFKYYNKLVFWFVLFFLVNIFCMMLYSWFLLFISVFRLEDVLELLIDLTGDVLGLIVFFMTVLSVLSEFDLLLEKLFLNCE